jgi:hypothetical protein
MKIKVLEYTLESTLTDHEKVFINFMAYLNRFHETKGVRFYMSSHDIKHILGHIKPHASKTRKITEEYKLRNPWLDTLSKSFKIGMASSSTWFIEFRDCPAEYKSQNGMYNIVETEITDAEAIKVYYYLMGRLSAPESVVSKGIKIYDGNATTSSTLHPFFKDYALI